MIIDNNTVETFYNIGTYGSFFVTSTFCTNGIVSHFTMRTVSQTTRYRYSTVTSSIKTVSCFLSTILSCPTNTESCL